MKLVSDPRLVLASISLVVSLLVGFTFRSTSPMLIGWSIAAVAVAWQTRRIVPGQCSTAAEPQTNRGRRVSGAVQLTAGAAVVCSVVVLIRMPVLQDLSVTKLLGGIDLIAHLAIGLCLLFWTLWPTRGHVLMLGLACLATMMATAAGGVSPTVTGQSVIAILGVVGFVLACQVIPVPRRRVATEVLVHPTGSTPPRSNPRRSLAGVHTGHLVTLAILLPVATLLTRGLQGALPQIRAGVMQGLRDRLENSPQLGWAGPGKYVSGSKLGSIRDHMTSSSEAVAIRGTSERRPGYLSGRVMDDYQAGQWRTRRRRPADPHRDAIGSRRPATYRQSPWQQPSDAPATSQQPIPRYTIGLATIAQPVDAQMALIGGATGPPIDAEPRLQLRGEPLMGTSLFAPATAVWLEAVSRSLSIDAHGQPIGGADLSYPYRLAILDNPPPDRLDPADRALMLRIAPAIRPTVTSTAARLFAGRRTPAQKAAAVVNYFADFKYSLRETPSPPGVDPLTHFLKSRHPAHCEYFATAAAMLMRAGGVPTRYRTGYVMEEYSDESDYYLARQRDAHSWVEYLEESAGRWVALEATPGRQYESLPGQSEQSAGGGGAAGDLDGQGETDRRRWWQEIWSQLRAFRVSNVVVGGYQLLQIPLLLTLIVWFLRRQFAGRFVEDPLTAERRRMDRWIAQWGLSRGPAETLHQFADRIDAAMPPGAASELLRGAAAWYRRHAETIYRAAGR